MAEQKLEQLVAPFMGAWIEIFTYKMQIDKDRIVAPFMGAWIEINKYKLQDKVNIEVAPFMGAWIEILSFSSSYIIKFRRTLHGCVD